MNAFGRIVKEVKACISALKLLPPPYNRKKFVCFIDMLYSICKYGALADDYISMAFYSKSHAEKKEYVTSGNKRLFYRGFYDDDARNTLAKKNLFSKRFANYVKRDWIWTEDVSQQEIENFISNHGRVVVKPASSTWGIGVRVIDKSELRTIIDDVKQGKHYMIEEVLVNHPDIRKLNSSSLHTLRVETCIDNKGNFHLLNVLLMVGMKHTIVSNCHSGGVMCHIDMKTGKVDKEGYNPQGWWCDVHPQSNIKFVGFKVPLIEQLEEYIKGVSFVMPNARYVGWDVAITPSGFELIEGNFCPGQCTQVCDGIPKYQMLKSWL